MIDKKVVFFDAKKRKKIRYEIANSLDKARNIAKRGGNLHQALMYVERSLKNVHELIDYNDKQPNKAEIEILKESITVAENLKSYLQKRIEAQKLSKHFNKVQTRVFLRKK